MLLELEVAVELLELEVAPELLDDAFVFLDGFLAVGILLLRPAGITETMRHNSITDIMISAWSASWLLKYTWPACAKMASLSENGYRG